MRVSQGLSATSTGSYHMLGGVHRQLKVLVAFDEAIVEQELLFAADIDWILCHGSVPYGDVWTYSARKSHGPFSGGREIICVRGTSHTRQRGAASRYTR
jgi:hypothetical protein